ncbi:MAG: YjjG family noncanonical pyrimidine nucleotidase [Oscillospiraceae bacterium]|jgi:2-haloacid dehalogenase|nr:YjjG family noncanonical pyrimidine nucleotidase [Oscillospiraceae bacterium]
MYKHIFFDLDDTLLDFGWAEHIGLCKAFSDLGICTDEALLSRFREINTQQWESFERGETTREILLVRRFALLFEELGFPHDPALCENAYREYLGQGHCFVDGAQALLEYLRPKYALYLASNGIARVQRSRLASAGIAPYFKNIFISEETGFHKPQRAFFDYCFARIPDFSQENALIIGDSLTSDILGGNTAGIDTCWFNPHAKPARPDIVPTIEIRSLRELNTIL